MKLNVGCGSKTLVGWVNVDIVPGEGVDVVAPITELPFEDNSCQEVMGIHVLEHLYPWDADAALSEFMRVLAPGGRLILELPDFRKCCQNIAEDLKHPKHPDALGLFGLFGDPRNRNPHMMHRWGYTPETLCTLLLTHGYSRIRRETPHYHSVGRHFRDMRIVCSKPEM